MYHLLKAAPVRRESEWHGSVRVFFHVTTTADINADNKTWHEMRESKKSFNIS